MKGIKLHKLKSGAVSSVTISRKYFPDVVEYLLDIAIVERSFCEPLIESKKVMMKIEKRLKISHDIPDTLQKKRSKRS